MDPYLHFNTLLAVINKVGMRDLFSNQEPYLFIAPTDAAFAALPKKQLDTLLNNPQPTDQTYQDVFHPWLLSFGNLNEGIYGYAGREYKFGRAKN